ncbi:MAG: hypothetical protein NZ774_06860, partial [Candidatus Poseidoniales archaeon]|nr:hypothetical protein [Candidatus Poseidoniales archaeon]
RIGAAVGANIVIINSVLSARIGNQITNPMQAEMVNQITNPMRAEMVDIQAVAEVVNNASTRTVTEYGDELMSASTLNR